MRLFLVLVVLLMVQYKTFGQQILIKEDFEFYWPMQQYDIEGGWELVGNVYNSESKRLSMSDNSSWYFTGCSNYDSVYVEVDISYGGLVTYSFYTGIQYSSDSITWNNALTPTTINSQIYPHIRLYTEHTGKPVDNLLVIGYSDIPITNCQFDSNQDGAINVPDLIDFLSWYGTTAVCD